jgi:ribonuclease G
MLLNKVIIVRQAEHVYAFAYSAGKLVFVTQDLPGAASESIFYAKITKLNAANHTAFVEYLSGVSGFINLPSKLNVQSGSLLPVQLTWQGNEQKQAKLRYGWSLIGKYVVYLADTPVRIKTTELSQPLRDRITQAVQEFPAQWVLRSCVDDKLDFAVVAEEMKDLYQQALTIKANAKCGQVYAGMANYLKLLRSLKLAENCEIISNDPLIHEQLLAYQNLWQIDILSFDPKLNGAELIAEYKHLLASSLVNLSNGASLEINTLSGISLIDVNSNQSNLAGHKLNFLVLDAIYQQICLRNLQGIILLDLVKNMSDVEQQRILLYLTKLFKNDLTNTKILGFSHSGLCEIIRNKF